MVSRIARRVVRTPILTLAHYLTVEGIVFATVAAGKVRVHRDNKVVGFGWRSVTL